MQILNILNSLSWGNYFLTNLDIIHVFNVYTIQRNFRRLKISRLANIEKKYFLTIAMESEKSY